MKVKVVAASRLHISLIDLGISGYRRNGGIGFSVDGYDHIIDYSKNSTVDLSELSSLSFTAAQLEALARRCERVCRDYKLPSSVRVDAASGPTRHQGFGTGTAVSLATIEALFRINGVPVDEDVLIDCSGRGGASGIGIHSYFKGGFILDVGRCFDSSPIRSSEHVEHVIETPWMLLRLNFPGWEFGLLTTPRFVPLTDKQEQELFDSLPLAQTEVFETTYHCVFGAAAGVSSANYDAFCKSINSIQLCAWKQREIAKHGDGVLVAMEQLRTLGCDAVGMTSAGPSLYFFSQDMPRIVREISHRIPGAEVRVLRGRNKGREVSFA